MSVQSVGVGVRVRVRDTRGGWALDAVLGFDGRE